MRNIISFTKIIIITAFCGLLNSSLFTYETNIMNENAIKNVDYITIESEQYNSYIDSLYEPISTFTAELTGYGADCEGCTGLLACKYMKKDIVYVKDNEIYINDKEYGRVRIVAADWSKYPCGTIMKFSSKRFGDEPVIAVVMDKGGAIQENRLDLLAESEAHSAKYVGRIKNLKVEVLRKGW